MAGGRRTSLATLAGQKVEDVPGRSDAVLLSLPLDKLHCTRFNPRRNFGTDDDLRDFGEKLKREQLQPAVVVSRAGYLKLWPDEADNVGAAPYVIANGERRYRASRLVGRPVLEVVHREDVAHSRATFLDAVQSENNDRQDLDPIERAIAIETMVTELGGADQVAAYYGKTKGWVSQQRKLLKLTPALQDLVSSGNMPVRIARDIAGLPGDVQASAWEEHLERRRLEKEAGARLRAEAANPAAPTSPVAAAGQAAAQADRFTAVNRAATEDGFTAVKPVPVPEPSHEPQVQREERFTAVNRQPSPAAPLSPADRPGGPVEAAPAQEPAGRAESIPEPRQRDEGDHPQAKPPSFPYDIPAEAVMHLGVKTRPDHLWELVERLNVKLCETDSGRYEEMLRSVREKATPGT